LADNCVASGSGGTSDKDFWDRHTQSFFVAADSV
jgi:hypothetical protein